MKDSTADLAMIVGRWYKIRHRADGERYDRMSVMQYLGAVDRGTVSHQFNARPVAGTQTLPHNSIISVQEVPATSTPIVAGRWVTGSGKRATSKAAK